MSNIPGKPTAVMIQIISTVISGSLKCKLAIFYAVKVKYDKTSDASELFLQIFGATKIVGLQNDGPNHSAGIYRTGK